MKEIFLSGKEIFRLRDCLAALAEHHNAVTQHFKGVFPLQPIDLVMAGMAEAEKKGTALIKALEEGGDIVGFCKIATEKERGSLDYLYVREDQRGKGYGRLLMDWAMAAFQQRGARFIDVNVVLGNPAQGLYEAYGFVPRTLVMSQQIQHF
ncbi:GNAT family N-acetyltransferase [Gehongia tenuis]|uniref:GNAT family N-acetyltransferase n=1 Tax=Gehongia tenuis TaxID=2763655 RepID=A0A926HQZ5_9FIRM|nr:GNAT family N-acetyltransferase [Gehongia tenuis]MBC8532265.1 GNAT family N-acetyltransferase [Gehongia tenuis]